MEETIERAKEVLSKNFCLMHWQREDAEKRGEAVMEKEDIEFLLSLNGITKEEVMQFGTVEDLETGTYDSEKFFTSLNEACEKNLQGISTWARLTEEDVARVNQMGYLIHYTGYHSSMWDEVYFSEEAFIRVRIASFKNLFGDLASLVASNII